MTTPWTHNPRPIATLKPETDKSCLLFCSDQGGWHTGEWRVIDEPVGRWAAVADISITLDPSHWDDVPLQWIAGGEVKTVGSA